MKMVKSRANQLRDYGDQRLNKRRARHFIQYHVKSTTPGCEDAHGKFRPKVEECYLTPNVAAIQANRVEFVTQLRYPHSPSCKYNQEP